mmetsp:Transcript_42479/g.43049  ORF Transcript_42479/g.43049 Transcript_42479/m.43049 type:complete len:148 (-) Transcript_42479:524-967(-)
MSNLLGSNNEQEFTSEPPIIEPSTPWVAAGDGDLPLFQTALSKLQLKIDAADENGFTFYHAAAAYNRVHVLRWLFDESRRFLSKEHEKDVCSSERQNFANAVDSDGEKEMDYPLYFCCRGDSGNLESLISCNPKLPKATEYILAQKR